MTAEQRLGLPEETTLTALVHGSTEAGGQGTNAGTEHRSDDLTAKHRDLVAEHNDLDRQIAAVTVPQADQLEDLDEGKVVEREGHDPGSASLAVPGKSWSRYPDDIVGTHRIG